MPKLNFTVGDEVAFNNLDDATVFEVLAIDGFAMTVREAGRPNYAEQRTDVSLVKRIRGKAA